MLISNDNICRGIYFIDTSEVCFDGYNYFTGHYAATKNYCKAEKMFQHIKRRYESNV